MVTQVDFRYERTIQRGFRERSLAIGAPASCNSHTRGTLIAIAKCSTSDHFLGIDSAIHRDLEVQAQLCD